VTATDFHFAFKPKVKYKHGVKYTFKLVNKGAALHNFDIQGVKATKIISPGKTASMTITFKKAGKYPYLCDVPRHGGHAQGRLIGPSSELRRRGGEPPRRLSL